MSIRRLLERGYCVRNDQAHESYNKKYPSILIVINYSLFHTETCCNIFINILKFKDIISHLKYNII
jgi:hypothetical protein